MGVILKLCCLVFRPKFQAQKNEPSQSEVLVMAGRDKADLKSTQRIVFTYFEFHLGPSKFSQRYGESAFQSLPLNEESASRCREFQVSKPINYIKFWFCGASFKVALYLGILMPR